MKLFKLTSLFVVTFVTTPTGCDDVENQDQSWALIDTDEDVQGANDLQQDPPLEEPVDEFEVSMDRGFGQVASAGVETSDVLYAGGYPAAGGLCGGYHVGAHCTVKCSDGWHDLGSGVAYGYCQEIGISWCWYANNQHLGYQGACWSF